ncbi:transposable element Tcb2 transposase [Trichonephila clavipes]|nr:transposable element Tcb2 transposase [Trichonephila clavipes]
MSQRSHLNDSEAWRVVGRLEESQTQAEKAQAIGVSQSVISRIWNHFLETGSAGRRPGQGRRRATTPNEDRYLVLTATLLQQHQGFNSDCPKPAPWCRRIFIWRDRDSRNNPAFVHESVRFGSGGVLVYGGISIDGRTDLYIIRDGPLIVCRYRDEILRPL